MVNDRTDAVVYPYTRRQVPALEESFRTFVPGELQQIERSIKSLADAVPQVAEVAPDKPRKGMVRYAMSPWNPLGNGQEGLVVYNGTAWKGYAKVEGASFTGAVTGTDLTLSGGVYLGGTGSANKLDDYEEGTWTPEISFNGGQTGITYAAQFGLYTKIGNFVIAWFTCKLSNKGSSTGAVRIEGEPFAPSGASGLFPMSPINTFGLTATQQTIIQTNPPIFEIKIAGTDSPLTDANCNNDASFRGTIIYRTNA